ncbi:hypothetical protein QVZ43_01205 [Marinobacter sp. chi1]|uniref:O-antigen ligase family protein n=1 Tax=Marinobacter suaedae TaxID=3057675 RepID=A0ABT8VWL0_9GAMM|nr:O-antigen ligase family protein [Marinobacter sp. chi1]MDO3720315.1 hypothetical protein [Marinobacter sp. chi1]
MPEQHLRRRMPFIMWALAVGLLVNFVPIFLPFLSGLPLSFLGWVLPLVGCGLYLLMKSGRVSFPLLIWLPWAAWVLAYLLLAEAANAFQRSIMLLTPLVVGTAFSCIRVDVVFLEQCRRWMMIFVLVYLLASVIAKGSGASGVITAALLASWLAAGYGMFNLRRDMALWGLLALVPVISVTRMGILAVGATLPATLSPLALHKRIAVVVLVVIGGLAAFQLESVQEKMFFSGQGTLKQAFQSGIAMLSGNADAVTGDFRTNARLGMTLTLKAQVQEAYWFGHGANAVEEITRTYFDGLTHPHNDWLRLQHDYGTLGMLIFAFTLVVQALSAWRVARTLHGEAARFMYAAASAFIPMAMFMFTDNVIMYVAWFGNLHFAMLGLGYAAARSQRTGLL